MLVLQVVVQAKTPGCKMLADNGHPEIGAILAAVALRNRKPQVAGFVREIFHPAQQRFPFRPRQPAMLEIGARPFAAVIEEADVVIGFFNRLDLARDELVELGEIGDQVGRQCKIQGAAPKTFYCCCDTAWPRFSDRLRWQPLTKSSAVSLILRRRTCAVSKDEVFSIHHGSRRAQRARSSP